MMSAPATRWVSRRDCLALIGLAAAAVPLAAHEQLGPVNPRRRAPPLPLNLHDQRTALLPALLEGRITALQLMFTGCSAVCPVQGAVFAALQSQLRDALPNAQLLSLSIDPLGDSVQALDGWRRRFGAGPAWLAAAPPLAHAGAMTRFLDDPPGAGRDADRHSAQVYLFDTQARLAYRCADLAGARDIARAMRELARLG